MTTYTSSLALQAALDRINNPPFVINSKDESVQTNYEHYVGTWALTKLKEVFSEEQWAITPEQKDGYSKKKPDLVVEKAVSYVTPTSNTSSQTPSKPSLQIYMVMELKKVGERKEDALNQICESILETVDKKGNALGTESEFEVYAVVQNGVEIGFFEFHSDADNLDEEDIPHFRGCVSLTQDYSINGKLEVVLPDKPEELELLFSDSSRLRKTSNVRDEAKDYNIPCFFNLNRHETEIHFLFQHMANKKPRTSW